MRLRFCAVRSEMEEALKAYKFQSEKWWFSETMEAGSEADWLRDWRHHFYYIASAYNFPFTPNKSNLLNFKAQTGISIMRIMITFHSRFLFVHKDFMEHNSPIGRMISCFSFRPLQARR